MFYQLQYRFEFVLSVIIFSCHVLAADMATQSEYRVIETTNGFVRGLSLLTHFNRKPYYAFKGIPYAQPPLNTLRFKSPVRHNPWSETRDAFEFGANCLQINRETNNIDGSENCLFLNIYTPGLDIQIDEKFPVMFFIHGGQFQFGSGNDNLHGPDFIMENNVILVTINYRLGALGFLSLGTAEYSGNAGLKDQIMALQWIYENIGNFGGDNKQITISGHSAGSASIHFLILSQAAHGLYQRAIMMAGSAITPNAYYDKTEHLLISFHIAHSEGNFVNNYNDLVKYLIQADANTFMNKEYEGYWLPVAEVNGAENPVLTKSPAQYLHNKLDDIDLLCGFSSAEALLFVADHITNKGFLEQMNKNLIIGYSEYFELKPETKEFTEAMQEIRNYYFGIDGVISNETATEYVEMYSDIFTFFIDYAIQMYAKNSNGRIYYYRLSADTSLNWHKRKLNVSSIIGATHGDELCYLFRCHVDTKLYNYIEENSSEMKLIRQITKLWTDFVKFGNPTPNNDPLEFKPIDGDDINFMDIGKDSLVMALSPNAKSFKFWADFLEKYNRKQIVQDRTEL